MLFEMEDDDKNMEPKKTVNVLDYVTNNARSLYVTIFLSDKDFSDILRATLSQILYREKVYLPPSLLY